MNTPPPTLDISAFKHVMVPFGVVIGMGLAFVVGGASRYLSERKRVRVSWEYMVWVAILFLWFVLLWWIAWGLRLVPADKWTFSALMFLLIGPALLYMASSLILPAVPAEGELDLGERFSEVGRPFFLCLAGVVMWLGVSEIWLGGEPFASPKRLNQMIGLALLAVGVVRPTKRVAGVIGVLVLAIIVGATHTIRSKLG